MKPTTKKIRLVTLAASVGVVATMLPTHAATPASAKAQITDPAGDANGINDQGFGVADINGSAPVDDSNGDITSVVFATKFKTVTTTKTVIKIVKGKKVKKTVTVKSQVPDGFTVTMNLSAAPDDNHSYDVNATHPLCDGTLDFNYSSGPLGLNDISCLPSDPSSTDFPTFAGDVTAVGKSVVWTVPAGAFPNGSMFTDLVAQSSTAVTLPYIDEAGDGSGSYKVGS